MMKHELVKVKVTYNISASVMYTIEYLYNKKQDLIFYYHKEETHSVNKQTRLYLKNKNLIKTIYSVKEEMEEENKKTNTKSFKKSDLVLTKKVLYKSLKYKNMFKNLLEIEHIN